MLCEVNELLINPPSPTKANTCNLLNCKKLLLEDLENSYNLHINKFRSHISLHFCRA